MAPAQCGQAARLWSLLHDNVVAFPQPVDEVIRSQVGHEVVATAEPSSPIHVQRERQAEAKFLGVGGAEVGGFALHGGNLARGPNISSRLYPLPQRHQRGIEWHDVRWLYPGPPRQTVASADHSDLAGGDFGAFYCVEQ